MKMTAAVLLAFGMLSCARPAKVIPDERIPHRVAEETEIVVYSRHPDGTLVKETVVLREGWWVAAPRLIDP